MGGAEQYLFEMTKYLSASGHDVTVLFLKKKHTGFWQDQFKNTSVKLTYFESLSERKGILLLFKWILTNRSTFDYCLSSHIHLNGLIGGFRRMRLINIHQHIGRESTIAFDRLSGLSLFVRVTIYYLFGYRRLDLLITQSEKMKKSLLGNLKTRVLPKNIQTIPNLVDCDAIRKKSTEYVPDLKNYLVAAGRLIPEKGFDILIEAFSQLNDKNLHLVILGDGKLREILQSQVDTLNISSRVHLKGFLPNPMPYFLHAKACVVSSRIEGFPNVLLQMMCVNQQVVSTLCAGGIDQITGVFTCPPDDSNELKKAIEHCLHGNPDSSTRVFDLELKKRSLPSYWSTINRYLDE